MTILVVYSEEPTFPATDQNPDAIRYHVGQYWADCLGDEPTEADITSFLNPPVNPHLNSGGLLRFTGPAPSSVLEAIRMISVTRRGKGFYRGSFEIPMSSDQYTVWPSVLSSSVPLIARITARTATYVEMRVTDLSGVAQDPTEAMLKIERVIYS